MEDILWMQCLQPFQHMMCQRSYCYFFKFRSWHDLQQILTLKEFKCHVDVVFIFIDLLQSRKQRWLDFPENLYFLIDKLLLFRFETLFVYNLHSCIDFFLLVDATIEMVVHASLHFVSVSEVCLATEFLKLLQPSLRGNKDIGDMIRRERILKSWLNWLSSFLTMWVLILSMTSFAISSSFCNVIPYATLSPITSFSSPI